MNCLQFVSRSLGYCNLGWAGAVGDQNYLNFGDAMSPVIVSALSGIKVERSPTRSKGIRMASTGSILHNFSGGEVHVWGSGISPVHNPNTREKTGFQLPYDTSIIPYAVRGPHTKSVLMEAGLKFGRFGTAYGDPVWLTRRFYNPSIEKKYELGIIIHLTETDGREVDAGALKIPRYNIPESIGSQIKVINTLTQVSSKGLQDKIDEILSCKRLVSTSFHGLLLAELYGIPCMFIQNQEKSIYSARVDLNNPDKIDTRVLDFYLSAGLKKRLMAGLPKNKIVDWEVVINGIDKMYSPFEFSDDNLINSFPLDINPINNFMPSDNFFDFDHIKAIRFKHSVSDVIKQDRIRERKEIGLVSKGALK